jgi:hypothetical protein
MVDGQKLKTGLTIKPLPWQTPIDHPAQCERSEPGFRQIYEVRTITEHALPIGELAMKQLP